MTNSISLSSDLNTLFLIEESQVVAFPLVSKQGILIGNIQGQLVAATNKNAIDKKTVKIETVETDKSQIQFYYSDSLKQAFIIIIDIDANKGPNDSPNFNYRALTYNLAKENIVIRKSENKIFLFRIPQLRTITKDSVEPFRPFTSKK